MKPLSLFLLLLSFTASAQQTTYQKVIRNLGQIHILDLHPAADGGYIFAGDCWSSNQWNFCINSYLAKGNSNGNIEWSWAENCWEGTSEAAAIQPATDGGYIIAGYAVMVPGYALVAAKVDSNGAYLWQRQIQEGYYPRGYATAEAMGAYFFAGNTINVAQPGSLLVKTDLSGNVLWTKKYILPNEESCFYGITPTADSGLLLTGRAGFTGQSPLAADIWLVRTNLEGDTLWTRRYSTDPGDDMAVSALQAPDGGFVVYGQCTATIGGNSGRIFLMKIDTAGSIIWSRIYDLGISSIPGKLIPVAGGYALCGTVRMNPPLGTDAFLIRTNDTGEVRWARTYGGSGDDGFVGGGTTADGGFLLGGNTTSFSTSVSREAYLVRTDSLGQVDCYQKELQFHNGGILLIPQPGWPVITYSGTVTSHAYATSPDGQMVTLCTSATGVAEQPSAGSLTLAPVPASDRLTITGPVGLQQLVLTDITGKEVLRQRGTGTARIVSDVNELPAGMYLYAVELASGTWVQGKVTVQH